MSTHDLWASANDRFKARAGDWMVSGIIAAVVMHAGVFAFFPDLEAADVGVSANESTVVHIPPELEVPPPPDPIARPATPRVSETAPVDAVIPPTDFPSNPPESLRPPATGQRPSDVPVWTPRDVEPRLLNESEVRRVLEQRYPAVLREAGIGGNVVLYVFVNGEGLPKGSQVHESSGYPLLDAAAADVVERMRFSPAMNRDRTVGVWIVQRVEFRVR